MLDVEVNLKNQPLIYIEENLDYSVLTPNSMILGRISSYQMILQKRKKLVISGRSNKDMYKNVKKPLGKNGFMNTWQLSERDINLILKKNQ